MRFDTLPAGYTECRGGCGEALRVAVNRDGWCGRCTPRPVPRPANGPTSAPRRRTGPTEAEWQRQVTDLADTLGWEWLHVRRSIGRRDGSAGWQTTTNIAGWPDLLLWRPRRIIAAELKSESGKATAEQKRVLVALSQAGMEAYIWRPSDWPHVQRTLSGQDRA